MKFEPYPYQEEFIRRLHEGGSIAGWLEMGLGKTVCCLTYLNDLIYDQMRPVKMLVVAPPKVAADTWSTEAGKWDHLKHLRVVKLGGEEMTVIRRNKAGKKVWDKKSDEEARRAKLFGPGDVVVVSRNILGWVLNQYIEEKSGGKWKWTRPWPFGIVVLDEAKTYSDPIGTWHREVQRITRAGVQLVELTGTPAPNDYEPVFGQIRLLDGGQRLGKTLKEFHENYMEPSGYVQTANGLQVTGWVPREGKREEIHERIRDICISMRARDWLKLPERIDRFIDVQIPMAPYRKLQKDLILRFPDANVRAKNGGALSSKLLQMANGAVYDDFRGVQEVHGAKLDALEEIVSENDNVLVFTAFQHDTARILKRMPKARVLKGPQDILDWNEGKIPVMLAHPAAAGHGLNIQAGGHVVVWFGMLFDLELYQQANARLHRNGQKNPCVIVHHLVARGTVDEKALAVLQGKATVQDALAEEVLYDGLA